jgi:HTH-type transcriptional regulator / antitoxin HipB
MSVPRTNLPELGLEVARVRREKGLSQRDLAKLSSLAQSTLARLETGNLNEFGSRKLLRLLEVLGCGLVVTPLHSSEAGFTLENALAERRAQVEYDTQRQADKPVFGDDK